MAAARRSFFIAGAAGHKRRPNGAGVYGTRCRTMPARGCGLGGKNCKHRQLNPERIYWRSVQGLVRITPQPLRCIRLIMAYYRCLVKYYVLQAIKFSCRPFYCRAAFHRAAFRQAGHHRAACRHQAAFRRRRRAPCRPCRPCRRLRSPP
jgi:hypothetical protein